MHQLHQFISSLNLSLKSGNTFFKTLKTKFIVQIIQLLIKHKYFTGYKSCSTKSYLIVFFKLTPGCQRPLLIKCTLVSNNSCPQYFKWSKLQSKGIYSNSGLFILTTTQGLMTQQEAYSNRLGGQILLKII